MKAGDGDREGVGLMGRTGSHCFQRREVVNQSCTLNSLLIIGHHIRIMRYHIRII